jgi:hypothetical protein
VRAQREQLGGFLRAVETTEIASAVAAFQAESKAELSADKQSWAEERDKQRATAEENLKLLRGLEKEAPDLVHAATGSVVATDYGAYAMRNSVAGWLCDVGAAVVGGCRRGGDSVPLVHE